MKKIIIGLIASLAVLVVPSAAMAEIRTGYVEDPMDGMPTISGVPNNPDISSVAVTYDTAGSVTITVNFFHSINAIDTSENYAGWGSFDVGRKDEPNPITCSGGVYGQHHVYSAQGNKFLDEGSLIGYAGRLPFSRSTSPDGRSVTIQAVSPVLANRDWNCFSYALRGRKHGSVSNINTDYDPTCDCWYHSGLMDLAGHHDSPPYYATWPPAIWFNGFAPLPPAEIRDSKKEGKKNQKPAKRYPALRLGENVAKKYVRMFMGMYFNRKRSRTYCFMDTKTVAECGADFRKGPIATAAWGTIKLRRARGGVAIWTYNLTVYKSNQRCYRKHGRQRRCLLSQKKYRGWEYR